MMKIPLHIVSGFLGSGKTTLLKKIIHTYSGQYRLGIIQNEFAPANVDGEELINTGKDFHLLEINNGSVFCACLLGDFSRSLEKFIDTCHPDILIIEASGLSDTTSTAEVILSGHLSDKLFLASNWCIVDTVNYHRTGSLKQRVEHQIRMADIVMINKTDLAEEQMVKKTVEEVRITNPFAEIQLTRFCDADIHIGQSAINKFYPGHNQSLAKPEINSMVMKSGKKISCESLVLFMKEWAPKSFRIKGYINLENAETWAVQSVFEKTEMAKTSQRFHPTELIALTDQFTLREWNQAFRKLS
ncbi:MAG: GTP-binding protein [Mariniphaga sp.]|nr:GTP-binding protein [Mariniphaga sp.]MDD4425256.1 GTP-binding protein [Mariniphaga sp.]